VFESDALNLRVGEHLARLAESVPGGIVYKASFDKANRSNAARIAVLAWTRDSRRSIASGQTGLPILTDVHLPSNARRRRRSWTYCNPGVPVSPNSICSSPQVARTQA
jgi:3-deoxy-D-manno-octulosonic acid (KDO) 8-phosphate synthase